LSALDVGVEWTRPQAVTKRAERESFMLVMGTMLDGRFDSSAVLTNSFFQSSRPYI